MFNQSTIESSVDHGLRAYMLSVYNWLAIGIFIAGFSSYLTYSAGFTAVFAASPWVFIGVSLVASLALLFGIFFSVGNFSATTTAILYILFSIAEGVFLSTIFAKYTTASIVSTFLITGAAFGGLSIYGYTTKRDLTGLMPVMFFALIGLIVASVVAIIFKSTFMSFLISIAGVAIFSVFIAMDTQVILKSYRSNMSSEERQQNAIIGAVSLLLDFINLFLHLLQLLGEKDD